MHFSKPLSLLLSLTTLTFAQLKSIPETCASDSECASGCCAFGPNLAGTCSGSVIALETKGGCGFGDSTPNANAAAASGFSQQAAAFSATLGAGSGSTAATAAAGNAGAAAASPAPTTLSTVLISAGVNEGTVISTAATATAEGAAPVASAAAGSGSGSTSSTSSSNCQVGTGNAVPGNGAGGSFITGCCESDADCASTCCDFTTGTCAAADVAKGNGHGCNFGGASPVFKNSVKRRNRVVPM